MATMASWNTRQFNMNAAMSQQHADITEDKYLELRRPRRITFYRNGDKYYPGKKLHITPHRYVSYNDLLSDLTKSVSLPYGVRRLYTPDNGTQVTDIEDLQDGKAYVCASFERFRRMKYGRHQRPSWHLGTGKKPGGYDNYLYSGGYTAYGPKYRGPLSYSYPVSGKFANAYGIGRPTIGPGYGTFGIGHAGPGSFSYQGGKPGVGGGFEMKPTANTHSDSSPLKPRIVRVVKGDDKRPRKIVSLLMNKRSVQSFEQLVGDISETLGVPKYKNDRVRKLFTLKGRELKGVGDLFRDDDVFIALPSKHNLNDNELQDIIEELYPENPYAKRLRKKKKDKDEKVKHDSGFGDDDDKGKKVKKKKDDEERKRLEDEERKRREAELAAKEEELKRKEEELKRREEEEKKKREKLKQDEIARREADLRRREAEMRKREEEERKKREKKPLPPTKREDKEGEGNKNKYAAEPRKKVDPSEIMKRYEIGKTIGDGNFAVVREARLVNTDQEYALKIIDKAKLKGKEHMLENEIGIMKAVKHPNIVRLFDEYETDENIYLVMEYVKGGDLFDAITESVKFTEHDAAGMVHDLATALSYLHSQNIVHRDIKPENLLVHRDEHGGITLKLADFGLAMEVKEPIYTVCGTPTYVAPEILAETGYGLEVDMWATGVITYILLCGFPPFRSLDRDQEELFEMIQKGEFEYLKPYWDNISESAKDLINQLLVVNKERRWKADQVLDHEWIQKGGKTSEAPNLQREITLNLEKNFKNRKSGRRQTAETKG